MNICNFFGLGVLFMLLCCLFVQGLVVGGVVVGIVVVGVLQCVFVVVIVILCLVGVLVVFSDICIELVIGELLVNFIGCI